MDTSLGHQQKTQRISDAGITGQHVEFTDNLRLSTKKEVFLSNHHNKQAFILLLSKVLESSGVCCLHAEGDADLLIAQTALRQAMTQSTTVVGEDTDLLILLLYYASKENTHPIFFRSDKNTGSKRRMWPIKWLVEKLGADVCNLLSAIHAFGGCDTTSRLYGIGKDLPLRMLPNEELKSSFEVFCQKDCAQQAVIEAGEMVFLCLYNGRKGLQNLNDLRYQRFKEKVSSSFTSVHIQSLLPTRAAAKYHSLRVYLQVQVILLFSLFYFLSFFPFPPFILIYHALPTLSSLSVLYLPHIERNRHTHKETNAYRKTAQ